jgi:2-methylisocitrate lyase-like PEP mutase family enzyme
VTGTPDQLTNARTLRDLHVPGRPLVLPNAWDVSSAMAVEQAGFPVVATSSAAVAGALGYPDDNTAPVAEMFAAAARIARAVAVPVTVDAEAGYQLPAAELVARLLETGAVGCNLEDTDHPTGRLVDVEQHCDRLAAVRAAADEAGVPLVINTRVDVFLLAGGNGKEASLVEQAVHRCRRYLVAGADCVYPILAREERSILVFTAALDGAPVNTIYGGIDVARAAELGVARVSLGGALWRATDGWLRGSLAELRAGRTPY